MFEVVCCCLSHMVIPCMDEIHRLVGSSLRRTASSSTCVPSKLMRLSYGFLVVAGGAMAVKLIFVCCVGSFRPLFFCFSFFFLLSVVGMVASFVLYRYVVEMSVCGT